MVVVVVVVVVCLCACARARACVISCANSTSRSTIRICVLVFIDTCLLVHISRGLQTKADVKLVVVVVYIYDIYTHPVFKHTHSFLCKSLEDCTQDVGCV